MLLSILLLLSIPLLRCRLSHLWLLLLLLLL